MMDRTRELVGYYSYQFVTDLYEGPACSGGVDCTTGLFIGHIRRVDGAGFNTFNAHGHYTYRTSFSYNSEASIVKRAAREPR